MRPKPAREAVAESYKRVTDTLCTVYAQANLDVLWNAYLAQEEELKELRQWWDLNPNLFQHKLAELQAENQALKADLRECIDAGKASMYAVDSNYYKCQEADELFSELSSKYKLEPQP